MKIFKNRSLCLWVVCPETGGVRKLRLSVISLTFGAFFFSFIFGALCGIAVDYQRLDQIRNRLFSSVQAAKQEKENLDAENSSLHAALKDVRGDNTRYLSYENELRVRLAKLEGTIRKALALSDNEKNKASVDVLSSKQGVGGAEISCSPHRSDYLRCRRAALSGFDDRNSGLPNSYSPNSEDVLKRVSEYANFLDHLPLGSPLSGDINSGYGFRKSPFSRGLSFHKGSDFSFDQGKVIHSTAAGVVSDVKYDRTYGRMVDIDHGFGVTTRYAHLAKHLVHKGQRVSRGDEIGIGGSSGLSTGPHLHYEVLVHRRARNPEKFVRLAAELEDLLATGMR